MQNPPARSSPPGPDDADSGAPGTRRDPRRRPGESLAEFARRRVSGLKRVRRVNPFVLLRERKHPLVRACWQSGRRRRWIGISFAAGVPLAVALVLWLLVRDGGLTLFGFSKDFEPLAAGFFVCFWPVAVALFAAMNTAEAVISERERDTGFQLVLTPLPRKTIAASRILPHLSAPMCAIVFALPIYIAVGDSSSGFTAWTLSPWRIFHCRGADWRLGATPVGLLVGLITCATDLGLVWAAAHWGACLGLEKMSRGRAILHTAGKAFAAGVFIYLTGWLAVIAVGAAVFSIGALVGYLFGYSTPSWSAVCAAVTFSVGAIAGAAIWWYFMVMGPVGAVLDSFAWFDSVIDEEFRPTRLARFGKLSRLGRQIPMLGRHPPRE